MTDTITFELLSETTTTKEVRWRRPEQVKLKTYAVLLNGTPVGRVFQDRQFMQKIRPGSRIADRQWYAIRWFAESFGEEGRRRGVPFETRQAAVKEMLERRPHVNVTLAQVEAATIRVLDQLKARDAAKAN